MTDPKHLKCTYIVVACYPLCVVLGQHGSWAFFRPTTSLHITALYHQSAARERDH